MVLLESGGGDPIHLTIVEEGVGRAHVSLSAKKCGGGLTHLVSEVEVGILGSPKKI